MSSDDESPPAFAEMVVDLPMAVAPQPPQPEAHVPSRQEALTRFSDLLFEIKDDIKNQTYIDLCQAAKDVASVETPRPAPQSVLSLPGGVADRVDQLRDLIGEQLHELRAENEGLETQLDSATVTIDRLRDRRKFYSKTTSALRGLLISHGVSDEEVLAAYAKVGVKEQVLKDRAERKRAREVDSVPNPGAAAPPPDMADEEYDLVLSE